MVPMKVAIHQPNYLPYIGYFQKMELSDMFVILDNVKFSKDSYIQRTKIRTPDNWMWLTIPIEKKYASRYIKDVSLPTDKKWLRKHKISIISNYSKCPFFDEEFIEEYFIEGENFKKLQEWNEFGIFYLKDRLNIKTDIIKASDLNLDENLKSTDLLVEIVNQVGGDTYISGAGGRKYMDISKFGKNDISLEYFEFEPFEYQQRWNGFEPYLSAMDLMFNLGSMNLASIPFKNRM